MLCIKRQNENVYFCPFSFHKKYKVNNYINKNIWNATRIHKWSEIELIKFPKIDANLNQYLKNKIEIMHISLLQTE